MIKKLLGMFLRPPLPQLLGLVLLTVVILVGGTEFRGFLGLSHRTLVGICIGVWVVAGLVYLWRRLQANKRAQLIEDRLRGQAREHKETVRPDRRQHVEALEKQLNEALGALKTSKMGKSALYALPWYVIIGPPGSGKTTLLRESGLSFPQLTHGRGVRGVGGTRNCDWWFTDAGILLDTAGRYTTQVEDRDEWISFLDMLKKARAQKPINGAMIAISIADVLQASEEQLVEHARKVRERLAELTERLELVFPVYLLFTKCDLLDGFVEMFGSYSKKERAQVWGFTLPYLQKQAEPVGDRFGREFDDLYQRLCAERLYNLGQAKSQAKKRKVYSFPLQFTLARDRLREFVGHLVQPNPYHESSDLRGFYFTSGTQEGKPLDQILRTMRLAQGLEAEAETTAEEQVDKKAYFIDELFTEVVFPDQDLARSSAKAERRRRVLQRVGLIATATATFLTMIYLFVAYAGHSNLIERSMRVCKEAAAFDPKNEQDLKREEDAATKDTAPFEQLRRLFVELDSTYGSVGTYLLGQNNALYDVRVRPLYVSLLRKTFLEPIQQRLRQELTVAVDAAGKDPNGKDRDVRVIADQLTGYRMLAGELLLNRDWLGDDFLKRQGLWTWRPGKEVEACRAHRETFIARVAGPSNKDWTFLPEEALIPRVNDLVRGKDLYGRELQSVLEQQGQAGTVSWAEILKQSPQAALLDDSIGVTAAWFHETPLDDILDQKGELLGSNSGDALKTRRRQEAIDEWKNKLALLRPRRKANLEDAMKDIATLTGEDSLYLGAYKEVCSRLQSLGIECPAGDTAWLLETLKAINSLQAVMLPLYESRGLLDRIVPAAKKGDDGVLGEIRRGLKKVRTIVRQKTEQYGPPPVRDAIQSCLMGTLDTLQYALAREIQDETNKVWEQGLGKELAEFSRRFPFREKVPELVEPDRFTPVFGKARSFDEALVWIRYLEQTLTEIGFAEVEPGFDADRTFVGRMQKAVFSGSDGAAGCDVEFLLQKLGNMSSVRFEMGDKKVEARATENPTLTWHPVDGGTIEIHEFQAFDDKLDSRLEHRDSWGLVRLLSEAANSTATVRGKDYIVYRWSSFLHPKTNQPLVVGDVKAEAALLLRTNVEPDPLAPSFFTHTFAREVFRELSR